MIKINLLENITRCINHEACNYTVFVQTYNVCCGANEASSYVIERAIGQDIVVDGFKDVDLQTLLDNVERCLTYKEFDSNSSLQDINDSEKLQCLLNELKADIKKIFHISNKVEEFWFRDGHPAYPVFWDFAYIFRFADRALIFIGSSSD